MEEESRDGTGRPVFAAGMAAGGSWQTSGRTGLGSGGSLQSSLNLTYIRCHMLLTDLYIPVPTLILYNTPLHNL